MEVALDVKRQEAARDRAVQAAVEVAYHLAQAEAAQARLRSLCEVWRLDPDTLEPQTQ